MEWRVLRVAVPPATAGPLADFLLAEGASGVVREVEGMTPDRVIVEAHVPASTHARVAAALAGYLAGTGDADIESAPLADVDWEAVFRRHHRPVLVGRRLAIAPPWDVPDVGGREVIVIEPGQAFGTGWPSPSTRRSGRGPGRTSTGTAPATSISSAGARTRVAAASTSWSRTCSPTRSCRTPPRSPQRRRGKVTSWCQGCWTHRWRR